MKIEISHDTLARKVYERASADDKMRLKVSTFLRTRYAEYLERNILLSVADLNYIEPYEKDLQTLFETTEPEKWQFVQRSKQRKYIWRGIMAASVVGIVITLATFWRSAETKSTMLALQRDVLENQKDSLKSLNDSLEQSRQRGAELLKSLGVKEGQLSDAMTALQHHKDSIEHVNRELKKAMRDLEEAQKELQAKKEAELLVVRREKDEADRKRQAAEDKTAKLQKQSNEIERSYILSAKAAELLESGKRAEAFRAAAEAWEIKPDNEQAATVLNRIHKVENNGSFGTRDLPIKEIVKKYNTKFSYKLKTIK